MIVIVLFIVIGMFSGSGSDNESKTTTSKKTTSVSKDDYDRVKKCLRDVFFSHMSNQLDFDYMAKRIHESIAPDKFAQVNIICKKSMNPMYKPTQEEADPIAKDGNSFSELSRDQQMGISFECRR